MSPHDHTQEALLAREDGAALDAEAQAHLDACDDCRSLAEALGSVDAQLLALAPIEPPAALVERTLEAARAQPAPTEPAMGAAGLLAATFGGLFSGLWAMARLLLAQLTARRVRIGLALSIPALAAVALLFGSATFMVGSEDATSAGPELVDGLLGMRGDDAPPAPTPTQVLADEEPVEEEEDEIAANADVGRSRSQVIHGLDDDRLDDYRLDGWRQGDGDEGGQAALLRQEIGDSPAFGGELERGYRGGRGRYQREASNLDATTLDTTRLDTTRLDTTRLDTSTFDTGQPDDGVEATGEGQLPALDPAAADLPPGSHRVEVRRPELSTEDSERSRDANQPGEVGELDGRYTVRLATPSSSVTRAPNGQAAEGEQGQRAQAGFYWQTLDPGVRFQDPSGYWANTYVPGDPAIRALRRRLADAPGAAALADLAQPTDPRLDPPRHGALALRVAADRAEVEGRSRVLVSVGLRGAAQRAGRRPTLRTQVVLDLRRPLDDAAQARVRALLTALSRTRDGADRTGVLVAGPRGGELLPLGRLRFGEVSVALRRAFEEPAGDETAAAAPSGAATTLAGAMERAVTSIGQLEDDASPLGSSLVLLVSPQLSDADARAVARVAHTGTLAGVTTTAVGLGDAASLDALERVALAGHGRRRVLSEPREASALVRAELTSVSRVVARAVRVRVRLAEGVQLVDVLGSHRLDDAAAQRVRASEQAIDRALASRLGITSDRGDDEDGIQIVVPAFYADDAHTILLDVVVPGPGPVLDAQVRFKDLLRLGNGTLTDRLQLGRGSRDAGPQERAVLTERLGFELASALREAARRLESGQPDAARARLDAARAQLATARRLAPELGSEPSLARDRNLVDRFRAALGAGTFTPDTMAGSLRYAAHRRVFGDPLGLGGSD